MCEFRSLGLRSNDATSSSRKYSSPNGIGSGAVYIPSEIQLGRPVIELKRCSSVYKDHHMRYRISFAISEVRVLMLCRFIPKDIEDRTAIPQTFQDLSGKVRRFPT